LEPVARNSEEVEKLRTDTDAKDPNLKMNIHFSKNTDMSGHQASEIS
jgi:hypothetical protein